MPARKHQRIIVERNGTKHYVNPLKTHKETLWVRQGSRCWICGEIMIREPMKNADGSHDGMHATIDHLVPQIAGGSDDISNLALAHYQCNCLRGRNVIQPIGKQLILAEQKISTLEKKVNKYHATAIAQTHSYLIVRNERDEALKQLHAYQTAPAYVCPCLFCAAKRYIADVINFHSGFLADRI